GIEQRQRAAHDLFGAAEWIAVERLQEARHVKRRRRRDRERELTGAWNEIGEEVAIQGQRLALSKRLDRAASQDLSGGLHHKRVLTLKRELSGAGQADRHGSCAYALGFDGQAQAPALLGVERDGLGGIGNRERSVRLDRDL